MKLSHIAATFLLATACTTAPPVTTDPNDNLPPGDDDPPPPGGDSGATAFLQAWAQKDCDQAFSCKASYTPPDAMTTFEDEFGPDAASCGADYYEADDLAKIESAITAGKILFDSSAATMCLAMITYPACAMFWTDGGDTPPACDDAMYGLVLDGEACAIDQECAGAEEISSICTAGKCAPEPPEAP